MTGYDRLRMLSTFADRAEQNRSERTQLREFVLTTIARLGKVYGAELAALLPPFIPKRKRATRATSILKTLEKHGVLVSAVEQERGSSGPGRRYYRLAPNTTNTGANDNG